MKNLHLFLTALFLCAILVTNAQDWQMLWDKQYGNNRMDYFTDVIEDKDDGFTVLGAIHPIGVSSYDFWLVRLNENGDTIWTKTFGTEFKDIPKKLLQTEDGYLLLGSVNQADSEKPLLIKVDKTGTKMWDKNFSDDLYCTAEDMISCGEEGFFLIGSKGIDKKSSKFWLTKLDKSGEIVWEKQFAKEFTGCLKSIKKLPDGGYSIAGEIAKPGKNDENMWVMRTDKNGDSMWETNIPSPGIKVWPQCVCCSPDSCFMIAGWQGTCMNDINSSDPIFDYDLVLVKLDCKGKVLWTKNFDREGSEGGNALTIRPDGNFVVAGIKATSFLGKIGPWLMLVDPEGNLISENLMQIHFNGDQAIKVINSNDGGIIVIGPGMQDESFTRSNGWIMKFASL